MTKLTFNYKDIKFEYKGFYVTLRQSDDPINDLKETRYLYYIKDLTDVPTIEWVDINYTHKIYDRKMTLREALGEGYSGLSWFLLAPRIIIKTQQEMLQDKVEQVKQLLDSYKDKIDTHKRVFDEVEGYMRG